MRGQKSDERGQIVEVRYVIIVVFVCLLSSIFYSLSAMAAEKWQGVDESVVQKIAMEHGREAHAPLINTDQGDMLLFVFLLAGAVGGFAAGYYWRMLTERRSGDSGQPAADAGKGRH